MMAKMSKVHNPFVKIGKFHTTNNIKKDKIVNNKRKRNYHKVFVNKVS